MSPLTLLPSAATQDGTAASGAGQSHAPAKDAWQREMERAQTRDWFRHDGTPAQSPAAPPETARATTTPDVAASPRAAARPPMPWTDIGARLATQRLVPGATAADAPQLLVSAAPGLDSSQPTHAATTAAWSPATTAGARADGGSSVDTPRPVAPVRPDTGHLAANLAASLATQLGTARSPVRVHLRWQGDTAQVWIGLDTAAALSSTEVAKAVARWLHDQGQQAGRITCNGVAVDLPSSAAGERPFTHLLPSGPEAVSPASRPEVDVIAHLTTREF